MCLSQPGGPFGHGGRCCSWGAARVSPVALKLQSDLCKSHGVTGGSRPQESLEMFNSVAPGNVHAKSVYSLDWLLPRQIPKEEEVITVLTFDQSESGD